MKKLTSPEEHALLDALTQIVGAEHVLRDADDCAPYEIDWRQRYRGRALCVVRPGSTEEVSAVVRACVEAGVPMVPQGGNTGHVGGGIPHADRSEVLISLGRLGRIRAIDPSNNTLTVEAGCVLAKVQEAARSIGRFFPLSLAAEGSCEIGGNLATNAGGVQVLRYGNARELTLGLEVVLPDGQIWNGLRGLRKDNTGYDLKQLFIGSEGTLGIITAAVLRLHPLPRSRLVAWAALSSTEETIELLHALNSVCGDRLSAYEIIGRSALELVLKHMPNAQEPLAASSPWCALIELTDPAENANLQDLFEAALADRIEQGRVLDVAVASSHAQAQALWNLREDIAEAQKREGFSVKHDISVPVSRIPEFLASAELAITAKFPPARIVAFGHAGDGNLHYNLSKAEAAENAAFIEITPAVNRVVHDLVHQLGGSISAEHGLGQLKREENRRYKSSVEMDLMQRLKDALDPAGLMNPGKLL